MRLEFLREVFAQNAEGTALVWNRQEFSYRWMLDARERWLHRLGQESVEARSIVALNADFSPNSVSLMLALIELDCIVVPLTASVQAKKDEFREIAQVNVDISVGADDAVVFKKGNTKASHPLLCGLLERGHAGLVLFSSGSTGKAKGILHDFVALLEKFKVRRHKKCVLTFLLFDHIGGINTLFYTLSNGGCAITVPERTPESVCEAIEKYKIQLLPASPTFLNLLLLSGAADQFDLSSLETVTYGTEVMPESTLKRFRAKFPSLNLLQTYGLSEVGILRSKSESPDSLWVKIGGEGFQTRVVDGLLEIKAESAMLGYLNAPSPFTTDGWLRTGDVVEVKGEYFRILGRKSEIINVGGEKVYPAEVEGVIQMMGEVKDVCVYGEPNAITGQIVAARVALHKPVDEKEFRSKLFGFCKERMPAFKIPRRVSFVKHGFHGGRFKKMRAEGTHAHAQIEGET